MPWLVLLLLFASAVVPATAASAAATATTAAAAAAAATDASCPRLPWFVAVSSEQVRVSPLSEPQSWQHNRPSQSGSHSASQSVSRQLSSKP